MFYMILQYQYNLNPNHPKFDDQYKLCYPPQINLNDIKEQQFSRTMKQGEANVYNPQNYSDGSSMSNPIIPTSMISSHLVNKLRTQNIPAMNILSYSSVGDKAHKYFVQYVKLFEQNKQLNSQLAEVIEDRNLLAEKYNSIKRMNSTEEAVHRKRRYAKDIQRLFHCPIEKCKRGYGSEGSLSHHVRLKHLEFYQSGQYEMFIQKLIDKMSSDKKEKQENHESQQERPIKKAKLLQQHEKSEAKHKENQQDAIKQENK